MEYNDASIYRRFLRGEKKALEELVRIYSDELVRYAYLYVRNSAVAEDVMEDVFTTLLVKRKPFFERTSFKAYLFKIARNKCMDYLRATKRKTVSLNDLENVLCAEDEERAFFKRQRDKLVYTCLQSLPEQYRDVLHLIYFDGFTVDETSIILKKNKKQTYNLLARAKSSLKEILQKEGIHREDL